MKTSSEKFAIVERYVMTPGIFTMQQRCSDKERLELIYKTENFRLKIVGPYKLNEVDALVLLNLLCIAAQDKKYIQAERQSEKGKKLRSQLDLIAEAVEDPALAVETTLYQFAQILNMNWCGKTAELLQKSLERMCATTFFLERKDRTDGFRLLSRLVIQKNEVAVCINPLLASAIINKTHFALVDLHILNSLKKPQERLLFIMLSNAVDRGRQRTFTQEEMRMIMYGEAKNSTVARKQKQRATEAIKNLNLPGFSASINDDKIITIERQK
uniref:Initiator Rep protein domain-containing protein n=1 Tax=uncultured prokaryote TaxID=198431 RepID=A0A0H5Q344_9ZZZZ|nr:hypothetical protein [uncultured prokaryote]